MKRSRKLLLFVLLPAIVLVLAMAPVAWAYINSGAPYVQHGGTASLNNIYIYVADTQAVNVDTAGKLTVTDSKFHTNTVAADLSKTGTVVASGGSQIKLDNTEVWSYGRSTFFGANGVYATGTSSRVIINGCQVYNAIYAGRGLYTSSDGRIVATNCEVSTRKSGGGAGVATSGDKGGTITFKGGSVVTTGGMGSAAFYSTGSITVQDSNAAAHAAEGACIDGGYSLTLNNTSLTASANNGVSLAKSPLSFITDDDPSLYSQTGGSLWAATNLFYAPNSKATIALNSVTTHTGTGVLLTTVYSGGGPGNDPSRGSDITINAANETFSGDIITDYASKVQLNLTKSSTIKGTFNGAYEGVVNVYIDSTSKWVVTGTSYINALTMPPKKGGGFTVRGGFGVPNIYSPGFTVYYNPAASPSLGGRTIPLSGGGQLVPLRRPIFVD